MNNKKTAVSATISARNSPAPMPTANSTAAAEMGPLGHLSTEQFFERYWQKEPVLIRSAFSAQQARAIDIESLLDLAVSGKCPSRLIRRKNWQLTHAPEALPPRNAANWTVLVQGVDREVPAVRQLLDQFRFIPDARLDDIMISYASDKGGIGAHVDSYDVFLLQGQGTRQWSIEKPNKKWVQANNIPIKLIENFRPESTYLLEPGDMLYVPPGWAHEGTAVGECTTLSIGFRAPKKSEFLRAWFEHLADNIDDMLLKDSQYTDPPSNSAINNPACIPPAMQRVMTQWMTESSVSEKTLSEEQSRFIGCFLTEPAATAIFPPVKPIENLPTWKKAVLKQGLQLSLPSRMLFDEQHVYFNGESVECSGKERQFLELLATQRQLSADQCQYLTNKNAQALINQLFDWYDDAWLVLGASSQ